jgi:hypothetical protein
MTESTHFRGQIRNILDDFPILDKRHLVLLPLIITPMYVRWLSPHICMYVWVRGDNHRTPALLDPKLAVESVSEAPGALKAHRDVVNRAIP